MEAGQHLRHDDVLQPDVGGVEGEPDGEGKLGVHEEARHRRPPFFDPAPSLLEPGLHLADERDGHPLLVVVGGGVQVQDLDDLEKEKKRHTIILFIEGGLK